MKPQLPTSNKPSQRAGKLARKFIKDLVKLQIRQTKKSLNRRLTQAEIKDIKEQYSAKNVK